MQSACSVACEHFAASLRRNCLGLQFQTPLPHSPSIPVRRGTFNVRCGFSGGRNSKSGKKPVSQKAKKGLRKGKDNVWSVDNEMADRDKEGEGVRKGKGEKRVRSARKRSGGDGRVVVSGAMLVETETVLQTGEPVVKPSWTTFSSSVSGIWKGVGAVFSPITAEMEPVDVGSKSEYLYDCYTLSRVALVPTANSGGNGSKIHRVINWVTLNPDGELQKKDGKGSMGDLNGGSKSTVANSVVPKYESFDFAQSDVMEEDVMGMEPGLVYFEDGSYSRGLLEIPVGELQNSNVPPTFKFEQCLVKGCHRRLRIVHTIDFNNGGADIQIMRVAVYEEEWASPAYMDDQSGGEFDLRLFFQRKRTQPSQLTGPWKVFEVSATPVFGADASVGESSGTDIPYVYLCAETIKKRSLPDNPLHFGEAEMLDMQDATVLWLPGGVTAYVDVDMEGTLCIGVGWYSDEGINLVMERDYGTDGKLKEVRWKSEVMKRWSDPMQD